MKLFRSAQLAVAQYVGSHQTTRSCLDALSRLLASSAAIERALLLSAEGRHGFYIAGNDPEPIFVRCGFASGYSGEGTAGLSIALHLLERFGVDVEEVVVSSYLLHRLDENRLTNADVRSILQAPIVRPTRIWDYRYEGLQGRGPAEAAMREQFTPCVPWSVVDERIVDLALALERDPDKAVFEAFRRLESIVARRAGLPIGTSGKEVFRKAFRGSGACLIWNGLPAGEVEGRAQLFEASFLAFRNPLAHREEQRNVYQAYREFYLVNELFLLEGEAVPASAVVGGD
ncbi:TIGR02391 family protein [Frateuria sp. GZRe12]|uniref:TIGR02391 family protein n=1 Tax=Frateuria sp. GZRe12 TaxID=3351533 RepID=UPI003EDBA064